MLALLTTLFDAVPALRKPPFAHPVSLSRSLLPSLQRGYLFSPKADGVRAMLWLITSREDVTITRKTILHAWLLFRNGSSRAIFGCEDEVPEQVLLRAHEQKMTDLSILDVEIVPGEESDTAEEMRLYAFDIMLYFNRVAVRQDLLERLLLMNTMIADLGSTVNRRNCILTGDEEIMKRSFPSATRSCVVLTHRNKRSTIVILAKPTFNVADYQFVTEHINVLISQQQHLLSQQSAAEEPKQQHRGQQQSIYELRNIKQHFDGTVFSRMLCRLSMFTTAPQNFIKHKPLSDITIDLVITNRDIKSNLSHTMGVPARYTTQSKGNVVLASTPLTMHASSMHLFARGTVTASDVMSVSPRNGVAEFVWSDETTSWLFVRPRPTKLAPNRLKTIVATINNIVNDRITVQDLVENFTGKTV